jgi:hypothetical protein
LDSFASTCIQKKQKRLALHHDVMAAEMDTTHHAAHRMTIKTAKDAARLAMIKTNLRISRCNVVIEADAAEESFAMRPLRVPCIHNEILTSAKYEKHAQDGVVTDLEDETDAGSADAKRPLKGDVLCLKSQIIRKKVVWGVRTRRTSRILSFDFSKRPAIASLYKETNYC